MKEEEQITENNKHISIHLHTIVHFYPEISIKLTRKKVCMRNSWKEDITWSYFVVMPAPMIAIEIVRDVFFQRTNIQIFFVQDD